ncbi:MAG TPA: DNA phosphorothioation system sulfurtransferase DndC [Pseudobdellovibrionaceae bacterium]|nr:DNA phosphorothioation system sulfurtransferase DndC [Pseudobdellovibrionaceae bacterium]
MSTKNSKAKADRRDSNTLKSTSKEGARVEAKTDSIGIAQKGSFFDSRSIKDLIKEVQDVYLADSRPWVVGYSGGKDSTAVAQLVFYAIEKLPAEKRKKKVYVISSDTLVETPVIVNHITDSMRMIGEAGKAKSLPIETEIVKPAIDETFWVNMIGKGYPAPTKQFRWCTHRMKIKPANKFILDRASESGEVVVVLGVRSAESATRQQAIALHKIPGQLLSRHSTLPNAFVYAPVVDFTTEDVWTFLLQTPNPWGGDNNKLLALYRNAQQGECPLVIDNTTQSCGNSRFGCWTCTVVKADKSMTAMIDNGEEWMEPLLQFREFLAATTDPAVKEQYRDYKRRDGRVMIQTRGEAAGEDSVVLGPYKFEVRQDMLRRLLLIQKQIHATQPTLELITREELREIRKLWMAEQQDWADSLSRIFFEVFGFEFETPLDEKPRFSSDDLELLKGLAGTEGVSWQMVAQLLEIEAETDSMARRSNIFGRLEKVLGEAWGSLDEEVQRLKTLEQMKLKVRNDSTLRGEA